MSPVSLDTAPPKIAKKKRKKSSPNQLFLKGLMAETEGNYDQAIRFYKAAKKHPEARYNLANLYGSNIEGNENNPKEALKIHQELAEEGYMPSISKMGYIHLLGLFGIEKNNEKAIEYFNKAQRNDDPESIFIIGFIYLIILEDSQENRAEAIKHFEKAARLNSENAIYYLGLCYEDGIGKKEDEKKADEHFSKAAKLNHPGALYQKGLRHYQGKYGKADPKKAEKLWLIAADYDYEDAIANLVEYYKQPENENPEKLLELQKKLANIYERAVNEGNEEYSVRLASCYAYGEGVEIDIDKAIELCKKDNDDESAFNLAAIYLGHKRNETEKSEGIKIFTKLALRKGKYQEYAVANLINHYQREDDTDNLKHWQDFQLSGYKTTTVPALDQKISTPAPKKDVSQTLHSLYKMVELIQKSDKPPEQKNILSLKNHFEKCEEMLKYKNLTDEEQKEKLAIKKFLKTNPSTGVKPTDNSNLTKGKSGNHETEL